MCVQPVSRCRTSRAVTMASTCFPSEARISPSTCGESTLRMSASAYRRNTEAQLLTAKDSKHLMTPDMQLSSQPQLSYSLWTLSAFWLILICSGWLGSRVVSVLDSGAKARVQIAAATLSANSLRQTVHTHCASVHQAAKLVAALLRVAGVTAGLAESNGSLPVYDSRHLQAYCQEPVSAPEPYAR